MSAYAVLKVWRYARYIAATFPQNVLLIMLMCLTIDDFLILGTFILQTDNISRNFAVSII